MNPNMRAFIATYLFAVIGLWSLLFGGIQTLYVVPHVLFYLVLTINTYFSIRFFSTFTPDSLFQQFVDVMLAAAYIGLALSIGQPLLFPLYALLIFTIAPVKYTHMLGRTLYDTTLRKKILIDLMGTLMCVCIISFTLFVSALLGAWMLALVFTLANIYLLGFKPMYRHG